MSHYNLLAITMLIKGGLTGEWMGKLVVDKAITTLVHFYSWSVFQTQKNDNIENANSLN